MKLSKETIVLILVSLLSFGFQLLFLFKIPFFSSSEAYFHYRHTKYIMEHFLPLVYDPQSYGGNVILNTHVWHYVLGFFDVWLPDVIVYKIIPALLAIGVILIVYRFAKELTGSIPAATFSALLSAFIPIYLSQTLNQVPLLSIFLPTLFLCLVFFLNIEKKKKHFLLLALFLVLLNPLNLLMLLTLLFFMILTFAEAIPVHGEEKEAVGFLVAFFLFINLVFYKQLYIEKGLATIWQNLPLELYGHIFQGFDLFQTIALIGVVPLVLGIIGFVLYREKKRPMIILQSLLAADFLLLLLRLIPFEEGVLVLAVTLCITAGVSIQRLAIYLPLTKMARLTKPVLGAVVVLSLASILIPSWIVATDVITTGVTAEEIEALEWIRDSTPVGSVIAGSVYEGNLIIVLANRTNIIDTQFLLAENRIRDVGTIFTTESLVKAKRALDPYNADYIYFSRRTMDLYGIEELKYTKDETCFETVFKNEFATVYEVVC